MTPTAATVRPLPPANAADRFFDCLLNLTMALAGYVLIGSFDWRLAIGLAFINGSRNGMEALRRQKAKVAE